MELTRFTQLNQLKAVVCLLLGMLVPLMTAQGTFFVFTFYFRSFVPLIFNAVL